MDTDSTALRYHVCRVSALVSCAQSMTFCLTLKGCAMNHQCAMLKTSVRHKYDERMVSHTDTPPGEGGNLPPPWRLSASSTQHCKKCQINTFKNMSYSPFEIRICCEKVSTNSLQCRCPSFSWPSWTPCRTGNLQLSLGSSPCHYWLDLSTNSRSLG